MKFQTALLTVLGLVSMSEAFAVPSITYRTFHYTCERGQKVSVAYARFGTADFAVLTYNGQQYALAPAVSASGSRYASLSGLTTRNSVGNGLEWWEAGGEGTLSTFTGTDTRSTKKLLGGCKVRR